MTGRAIIDAGPALNFCSINQQRLLISVTGALHAPRTVSDEVIRVAKNPDDLRFRGSEKVWRTLSGSKWLTILEDDASNEELVHALTRVGGHPGDLHKRMAKDLGERMVIAHASVMVQEGTDVTVLVDDGDGQTLVAKEQRYLLAQPESHSFGGLRLLSTPQVLVRAIRTEHVPDRKRMREIYARLVKLDDGLVKPIEKTNLLSHPAWGETEG